MKIEFDNSLLILDDDKPFLKSLSKALENRGFQVFAADSMEEFDRMLSVNVPNYAVLEIRVRDGTGLDAIEKIKKKRAESKIVILTGCGTIATAVIAVKIGAIDYLTKPANVDDLINSLVYGKNNKVPAPLKPMSADRVKWEYIQRVYELSKRNVSETARKLNMHRRTLQRILLKKSPK